MSVTSENTNNAFFTRVFDIGANLGEYTELMLKKGANEVIAVEASTQLASILSIAYRNNDKVKVLPKAASFNKNQVNLFLGSAHTISTANPDWILKSRFSKEYQWSAPVKIDAVTIDEMIETYGVPDHIKIDVEGYELQVLLGLSKFVPCVISFEWAEETKENIARSLYYLKELGYTKYAYTLNHDNFEAFDGAYTDFASFVKPFLSSLDPERKTEWGMIFVKP